MVGLRSLRQDQERLRNQLAATKAVSRQLREMQERGHGALPALANVIQTTVNRPASSRSLVDTGRLANLRWSTVPKRSAGSGARSSKFVVSVLRSESLFFSRVLELAAERSDEIREQDWTGEFGPNSEEENGRIEGNYE